MKRHSRLGTAVIFGVCFAALIGGLGLAVAATPQPQLFPPGSRPTGYKLGLLATACWMGGVWSDAEGTPTGAWKARDDERCRDLVESVYGHFDQGRYEEIRENEARSIGDLLAKIRATEPAPTRARTVALFSDVAAAMHEAMLARRAADRVKVDYDAHAVGAKLADNERTAAKVLDHHDALERLLVRPSLMSPDRRLIGLLLALDRMEVARGLPKQLKLHALGHVLTTVFDISPPPAAALDPTNEPRPGTWLAYLTGAARRVGHPVPDSSALTNDARETLAWTGVGLGFADLLREQASRLPPEAVPELSRVASSVSVRLETEHATAEAISKHSA